MSNFLSNLVEVSGNENASSVDKGLVSDIRGFIDTGSYTLNALLSGSLYGGIPDNKMTTRHAICRARISFYFQYASRTYVAYTLRIIR